MESDLFCQHVCFEFPCTNIFVGGYSWTSYMVFMPYEHKNLDILPGSCLALVGWLKLSMQSEDFIWKAASVFSAKKKIFFSSLWEPHKTHWPCCSSSIPALCFTAKNQNPTYIKIQETHRLRTKTEEGIRHCWVTNSSLVPLVLNSQSLPNDPNLSILFLSSLVVSVTSGKLQHPYLMPLAQPLLCIYLLVSPAQVLTCWH